jgi:hypothetical protein
MVDEQDEPKKFIVTKEMLQAFIDSLWRETYSACETRNIDKLYVSAINMMQIQASIRLLDKKESISK